MKKICTVSNGQRSRYERENLRRATEMRAFDILAASGRSVQGKGCPPKQKKKKKKVSKGLPIRHYFARKRFRSRGGERKTPNPCDLFHESYSEKKVRLRESLIGSRYFLWQALVAQRDVGKGRKGTEPLALGEWSCRNLKSSH